MEIQKLQVGMRRRFPPPVYGVYESSWKSFLGKPPATGEKHQPGKPAASKSWLPGEKLHQSWSQWKWVKSQKSKLFVLEWYIALYK